MLTWSVVGCGQSKPPAKVHTPSTVKPAQAPAQIREVAVAAASDLKFAFDELLVEFAKQHPDIQTKVTYGSSGNFFAQLSNKAPFDLYLSADVDYPRKLVEQDLAIADSLLSYAIGHVVVWVPKDSPLKVEDSGLQTLLDPAVQKIAIANPKHAPYGRAAVASLKSSMIYELIEDKLVLAENIAQAAQFVETGAADIGIISLSLAMAPTLSDKGRYWQIPATAHPPIEQAGVILSWARDIDAANEVKLYLTSAAGREVLKKYGFDEPAK